MNSKQLAILVAAGVVLGGAGLYVRKQQSAGYSASRSELGGAVLGKFDASAVAGVRITSGTNQMNVVKSGDDWVVKERASFPANFASIQELVRKLVELKVTQPVQVGPSRLAALELLPPDKGPSVLVELLGADGKPLRSLLLGKKYSKEAKDESGFGGWPVGRYVMVDGKIESIALVSEVFANAEPKPDDWLQKDWFKVEQPVFVAITHPEATNSFTLGRTNEFSEWSLAEAKDGEKIDASKVSVFSSLLGSPSFDDVVTDPKPDQLGLDKPTLASIKTSGGWDYEVRIGKPQEGDKYPVQFTVNASLVTKREPGKDEKKEDAEKLDKEFAAKLKTQQDKLAAEQARSKYTFLASKWTIDPLLKHRHDLMADPKKDEAKPAAAGDASAPVFTTPVIPNP
jgi:hypothetical protein